MQSADSQATPTKEPAASQLPENPNDPTQPEASAHKPSACPAKPNPHPNPQDPNPLPKITSPNNELLEILEAILFASQKPISIKDFQTIFKGAADSGLPLATTLAKLKDSEILNGLTELACKIENSATTYQLREVASGWHLVTRAKFAPWLRQLYTENRPARLSTPALETLAIIAYRQPITKADIEAIRGVAVDAVMQTLLDRGLVRIGGRAELPGRPLLYETTQFFLEHFGLRNLDELPNAAELRRVKLPASEDSQKTKSEENHVSPKPSRQNPDNPLTSTDKPEQPTQNTFTGQAADQPLQDPPPRHASANTDS